MTGVIIRDEFLWLPIYYLQPHEIVALRMEMGEAKWHDCELAGKKRSNPHVKAVAYGAEIRMTTRRTSDIPEFRPPADWLKDAGITVDSMRRALELVAA